MSNAQSPKVYWNQTNSDIYLRIDINNPQGSEIHFEDDSMQFSAFKPDENGPINYCFNLKFYKQTDRRENVYELIDQQLQFILRKQTEEKWPRLSTEDTDPSWIIPDSDKMTKKSLCNDKKTSKPVFKKLSEEYAGLNNKFHTEDFEKRDINEDYPHMYDKLHKEELGYRREDYKKVYLVFYNLFQFIGFLYILIIMGIKYSRDGPDSMKETYKSVGSLLKFAQLMQFLEVMHPIFGYTRGNPLIPFVQVGGRAFILFVMIESEERMQTKPVVFYLFFVWSLVEIFRYPYYITQLLKVNIPLITWLRYTVWIPLYPMGFLCEGIIVLRNIPYFEESKKYNVALPNAWNFSFHLPTFLRIYLLIFFLPALYMMMSHMNRARYEKLGKTKERKVIQQNLSFKFFAINFCLIAGFCIFFKWMGNTVKNFFDLHE
ncbi:very-long-chain (3R)-3-hydroxyacyl-CoA dehydratase [Microplitis demolitor]|uniref:very-long-chain (3R)-3-hydroxyacyl-CoA dehydratase n=1 Tax=Microplitis demolitor TaxID=69319 RepID=UPI00043FFDE2|nr:very-long-chain (3R)-3-hydroxyacyl-CoA dehydratase [Microplitis demolitor]XP_053594147.1 very-long-chain (3R)-3-hydroxyacyl-CoA dehydratase [Microplitis demolitor]